jgi:hypothetical protein
MAFPTVPTALTFHLLMAGTVLAQYDSTYYIVDTGQLQCYNTSGPISAPTSTQAFYGQDAQHAGNQPQYRDNGNGTISDLVTGLMWVKARGSKVSWEKAKADAATCSVGAYSDWRMPTIKELYSLIDFNGKSGLTAATSVAYLDTAYFEFEFGNTSLGERIIDCQDWSSTTYVHLTMGGDSTAFGVNFADGRIKGYPKHFPPTNTRTQMYVRYVRGNNSYGLNSFVDNLDSTISDRATGLMWSKPDSRGARNAANYLGYADWRLPNAKELQSIIDYSRSPSTTNSPAIDPIFLSTSLGSGEWPFYWTSTTHREGPPTSAGGAMAAYLCFGRGLGWMQQPPNSSNYVLLDVHGAGAQRSDPKTGDPANYPYGNGPQGDVIRINNVVRLVRGGNLIIPVELSSFRATVLSFTTRVRLQWTTESETNNLGFFIERRASSSDTWQQLDGVFISGHGTSTGRQSYEHTDQLPDVGSWWYRLRQVDTDGTHTYSAAVEINLEAADAAIAPAAMEIQNYPNPFNPVTRIAFSLPQDGIATLVVTDMLGREVARLMDAEMRSAGWHEVSFSGEGLPSGRFTCHLVCGNAAISRGMQLLK